MKIISINAVCGVGSTGKLVQLISESLIKQNIDNKVLYFEGKSDYKESIKIGNRFILLLNSFVSHFFGNYGFEDRYLTKKTIKIIKKFQPDIIHIHNIHNHSLNLEKFFTFLKKYNCKVVWTFHDCWAFTGYCTHFDFVGCKKWTSLCSDCPQRDNYSYICDKSRVNFIKKKKNLLENATIVTPSCWMKQLTLQSIYRNNEVVVINNGLSLQTINRPNIGEFRKQFKIGKNIKLILCVAYYFDQRKGIDDINWLSNNLPDDVKVVVVGKIKKGTNLSKKILHIDRTNNFNELIQIYNDCDVFVNPTYEDNYPTVNLEALAFQKPVVTYNTGGSPESMKGYGVIVDKGDKEGMLHATISLIHKKTKLKLNYKMNELSIERTVKQYLELYNNLLMRNSYGK